MTTETLKTELTRLEKGFESFQENHATRLSMLEKKMGARPASVMLEDGGTVATRDTPTARKAFANFLRGAGAVKSLTAGDAPGSYLLPSVVQERIERALDASETFRQIARHMTISSGSVEVIIDRDLPSVGWTSEVVERTETDPGQLARIKIDLHELYAKPKITQKILDDAAINVEDWIVDKVSQKMKQIEEQAFIVGDGDGKPRGFLTYETGETSRFGRLQHIKTGEDGGFGEQGTDALFNLVDSLKTEYLSQAVWMMSRSALSAIRQLKDPATGQYLWQPSLSDHAPSTLMGYPVYVSDAMPTLKKGTASASVAFGHFGEGYQIVERPQISMLRDPYSSKPFVEFYVSKRVGGDVINFDAIKVLKCEA